MPLQVVCPGCNAKLKAPDTAAGKKTKCPKCQAVISVPVDAPQAPAASPGVKKAENWHMQTTDGSQFGPVPRSELDEWFKEGRISADCQLLKEGADQWQWASEIYPSLEQPAISTPTKGASGFDFLGPATSTNNDPLGLGNAALTSAPQSLAPLPSGLQPLAPAPAFPTIAPSYGAPSFGGASAPSYGGGYGGGSYGAPANPYSSPNVASYGGSYDRPARTGLHPMVVISAVIEFIGGGFNLLGALFLGGFMLLLLIGGAGMATNMPRDEKGAEAAGALVAMTTGVGLLCALPFLILLLGLGILKLYTGFGLLQKRFWAKIVAIVISILYSLLYLLSFFLQLASMHVNPFSLISIVVGIAVNAVILTAMFLPDCTSDFS